MRDAGSWPHGGVKVRLVESDQSVVTLTTESLGSPLAIAGTKTLPGIAASPVFDEMTTARAVFGLLTL